MQADCLEENEVHQRKDEMARLIADGLPVFSFPTATMLSTLETAYSLSASLGDGAVADEAPSPFRPPFNVVAGAEADTAVHPYWFVRKYRCARLPVCATPLLFLHLCTSVRVSWRAECAGGQYVRRTAQVTRTSSCCASCSSRTASGSSSRLPTRASASANRVGTPLRQHRRLPCHPLQQPRLHHHRRRRRHRMRPSQRRIRK